MCEVKTQRDNGHLLSRDLISITFTYDFGTTVCLSVKFFGTFKVNEADSGNIRNDVMHCFIILDC